jgi:hypothetical protein
MSKANAFYRTAAILAVFCVVAPPALKVALTAIKTETEAEAQTYATVPAATVSGDGTIDNSGPILPDGTVNPNPATVPTVDSQQKTKHAPSVVPPNGCPPGQIPLLPGAGCPPNARACLPPPAGTTPIPRVPCGPQQQGANASAIAPPSAPTAVQ